MLEIVSDDKLYSVRGTSKKNSEIRNIKFKSISETKDFEGYYLGKMEDGKYLLFSEKGEIVYRFEKGEKPKDVSYLLQKIAETPEIIKKVEGTDFFMDRKVMSEMANKHKDYNKLLYTKTQKSDPVKAEGLWDIYELERKYLQKVQVQRKMQAMFSKEKTKNE